jgi:hypothetical protein
VTADLSGGPKPRGWTFDLGVPEIVAPYARSADVEQYERLRSGGAPAAKKWRGELRHGGLLYHSGITGEAAQRLLDVLPISSLCDRQNDSPTVGTFLRSAAKHPGVVELIGYCVGPDRADERFSVEGLLLVPTRKSELDFYVQTSDPWAEEPPKHEDRCQCRDLWELVQSTYGVDDALRFPTEIDAFSDYWTPNPRRGWRLWWT